VVTACSRRLSTAIALALLTALVGCADVSASDAGAPPMHVGANANVAYPVGPAGGALSGTYPNPAIPWTGDASGAQGGVVWLTDAGALQAAPWYGSQSGQFPTLGTPGITFAGPHVTACLGGAAGNTCSYTATFTGWVEVQGCGGGGGGGGGATGIGGGGGGGAQWTTKFVQVSLGTTYTITAPGPASGGTGSGSIGSNGTSGSDATFSTLVSLAGASGGQGGVIASGALGGCPTTSAGGAIATCGAPSIPVAGPPGTGGSGASSSSTAESGVRAMTRANNGGDACTGGTNGGGGGGGEGGNTQPTGGCGAGSNGQPTADAGAPSPGGSAPANSCGGGGGGGRYSSGIGANGGAGGSGVVLVFD